MRILLSLFSAVAKPSLLAATSLILMAPLAGLAKEPDAACTLTKHEIKDAVKRSEALIAGFLQNIDEKIGAAEQYGFAVAVSACGKIVWEKGFGFADLENGAPVTVKTKFRVGSVSKTLTSAALGQLVDAGKLDFDAEVQTYVPAFPRKEFPITVRQVAGHLAGIRHYAGNEFLSADHYDSVSAGLAIFQDDPLINRPGTAYSYSTYGWNLLSAVVEGASGDDFLDYMKTHVFAKANMADTLADINASIIPARSQFYDFDEDSGKNNSAPYVDNSNKWAGGGFLSTPTDLLHFAHAMFDGDLVTPETFSTMTTSQTTTAGEKTNYGIGWATDMAPRELQRAGEAFSEEQMARVADIIGDERIIGHSGGSVGGLTLFIATPDSAGDVVVAAVSNNSGFFPRFALPIAAEFIDAAGSD